MESDPEALLHKHSRILFTIFLQQTEIFDFIIFLLFFFSFLSFLLFVGKRMFRAVSLFCRGHPCIKMPGNISFLPREKKEDAK